jgi:hypothetical protein
MLELRDYAKREGISYTAACARVAKGKVKTVWGKKKTERWVPVRYVVEEGVKSE